MTVRSTIGTALVAVVCAGVGAYVGTTLATPRPSPTVADREPETDQRPASPTAIPTPTPTPSSTPTPAYAEESGPRVGVNDPLVRAAAANESHRRGNLVSAAFVAEDAQLEASIDACRAGQRIVLNNLVNAETTAFKRLVPVFREVGAVRSGSEFDVGHGIELVRTAVENTQGPLLQTERPLDVAIVGRGYFQLHDDDRIVFTRNGSFSLNANGEVVQIDGEQHRRLEPSITVPSDATEISITSEGTVSVRSPNAGNLVQLGQIEIAVFANAEGLRRMSNGLYAETDDSGAPMIGSPGSDGRGPLQQSFLEGSNVSPDREQRMLKRLRDWERSLLEAAD